MPGGKAHAREVIPPQAARRLLLAGQGLLADPARPATPARVLSQIRDLGFVQLDSINVVERAHHHILWSRLHNYRPATLDDLQRRGDVFEHWTHDASILPSEVFPHWRSRFAHVAWGSWLRTKMGDGHEAVATAVLERVRQQGPLMARDFEHPGRKSGPWWDWKPAKAALEYHWRTGTLAIPRRVNFQKVYDLTERVLPRVHGLPVPTRAEHVEWACRGALERLGAATPKEIAGYWGTVTLAETVAWCKAAVGEGRAAEVGLAAIERAGVGVGDVATRPGVALPDWRKRLARAPEPPSEMRLLSPFDPILRDRARCLRLFGFDYRFEAFVPEPKRKYGYYVLPVLHGDRLVARLDPKFDRESGTLRVRGVWWEPTIKPTRAMRVGLDAAVVKYAQLLGAERVEMGAR